MPKYLETFLENQDYSKMKGVYNYKTINKKIRLKDLKERKFGYAINGKVYPLIGKGTAKGDNVKFSNSKPTLELYKELMDNPSKEKYAEISSKISGMDKDFYIDLYDYANQKSFKTTWAAGYTGIISNERYTGAKPKKMRGGGKTGEEELPVDIANIDIESRPRTLDPEKYRDSSGKLKERFIEVGGKVLRADLLKKGDFGYVFRSKLFPIFKVDKLPVASNSWSLVSNKMLPQEKELFRRMSLLEDDDAISLYYDFFQNYNIPVEVITEALNLSNNDQTEDKIRNLERNFGDEAIKNGFNINYSGDGVFETITGTISQKIGEKFGTKETKRAIENRKQMSMDENEINDLFENTLGFESRNKLGSSRLKSQDDGKITENELQENIQAETDLKASVEIDADGDIIPPPPPIPPPPQMGAQAGAQAGAPPQAPPQAQAGAVPQAGAQAGAQAQPQAGAGAQPPPPPPPNNIQMNISEQLKGEALRLDEREKIAEQEENMKQELEQDSIPDISKYGHQLAVQNIFKKNNKDFTYFKNLVSTNKSLNPSQDKTKRKITTDIIVAEYSSLFPIDNLKSDYDYQECLEIATFKFGFIENVRFERTWKKSIGNMNIGTTSNTEGLSAGAIVNLENMGLNVNQLLNPNATGATTTTASTSSLPPVAPTDPKKRQTAGRVQRLGDYNIVRPPQNLKNKSTKKERKVKQRDVNMNIRMKTINNRLLFTNLNHNPQQQNIEIEGDLPTFNFRESNKKNRFKF